MKLDLSPENGKLIIVHDNEIGKKSNELDVWVSFHNQEGKKNKVSLTGAVSTQAEVPFEDVHGKGLERHIRSVRNHGDISLTYHIKSYDLRTYSLVRLSVENLRSEPIFLREICLLDSSASSDGQILLGSGDPNPCFFKVGWHGWDYTGMKLPGDSNSPAWTDRIPFASYSNPTTPKPHQPDEFWSEGWGLLALSNACMVIGLVTTANQFGQVYTCLQPGKKGYRLVAQLDGVRLDPGEMRDSEWGFVQLIPLPHPEPMADYVEAVGSEMKARIPSAPAPMWMHWYHFYHDISEQKLLETLDKLHEQRDVLPFGVVELDDGYQAAWGDWTTTNEKFPHGLGWLAERIRGKGFRPGLWLAPFVVHSKSRIAQQHPEWLIKNKRGKPAFAGFVYNLVLHALDLTNPEVLEYLQQLAFELTHKMGYEMLKIDFINSAALPGKRMNPKLTRAEALRAGLEAIRHGAGKDTFLLGSGCPFGPAVGIMDAMRIGPDTAPSWEPYFNWLEWVGPLVKSNPSMPSLRNALRNTINLSCLHQRWWWNDPDCLLVRDSDTQLSEAEVQTAITLVGLSGGLLVVSDDMDMVSRERLGWVSKLVPSLGLRALPLNILEGEMPGSYRVKLEHNGQAWQLVALINWSDQPADVSLQFTDLGYPSGSRLHLFDFWNGEYHLQKHQKWSIRVSVRMDASWCGCVRQGKVSRLWEIPCIFPRERSLFHCA